VTARVIVITDRKRFAVERVREMGGSIAIQVREKDLEGGALLALVREMQKFAPVWVNDRLDVAMAAGAAGVHLPERGLSIEDARAVAALPIGCSRHSVAGVLEAAERGASLIQFGPIWATPGKGPALGPEVLAVRAQLPAHVRLVAVGGIDSAERAREAAEAGADAVAVIRAAWEHPERIAEMVAALK